MARAQDLEVGLIGGGCYYLGDLNPGKHFLNTNVAYGITTRLNIDTRWAVKISAMRSEIEGHASSTGFPARPGLSFTSNLTDISGVVEFNFRPYFTGSRMNAFTPYIMGGISAFFYNPFSQGVELRPLGTEGQNIGYEGRKPYGSVGISLPFGLGVKASISQRIGLQLYWEMHKTFNDYLDDVSTTYYLDGAVIDRNDQAATASDPTMNHKPGMQRGNASNKDWYAFVGLSVTYKFNIFKSNKCRDLNH